MMLGTVKRVEQGERRRFIDIFGAMSSDEYEKAVKFHEFLKKLSQNNRGFLPIEREEFVRLAMGIMNIDDPFMAYKIIRKMQDYGMILDWQDHLVEVSV